MLYFPKQPLGKIAESKAFTMPTSDTVVYSLLFMGPINNKFLACELVSAYLPPNIGSELIPPITLLSCSLFAGFIDATILISHASLMACKTYVYPVAAHLRVMGGDLVHGENFIGCFVQTTSVTFLVISYSLFTFMVFNRLPLSLSTLCFLITIQMTHWAGQFSLPLLVAFTPTTAIAAVWMYACSTAECSVFQICCNLSALDTVPIYFSLPFYSSASDFPIANEVIHQHLSLAINIQLLPLFFYLAFKLPLYFHAVTFATLLLLLQAGLQPRYPVLHIVLTVFTFLVIASTYLQLCCADAMLLLAHTSHHHTTGICLLLMLVTILFLYSPYEQFKLPLLLTQVVQRHISPLPITCTVNYYLYSLVKYFKLRLPLLEDLAVKRFVRGM